MLLTHPHLTPAFLRAAAAAPFPRRRVGPRPISIMGLHLPMLSVKMLPYFVILQVCAAIEACHQYMVEQGIELAIRYGRDSSVYDLDAPFAAYTRRWLRRCPDAELRRALGWEVERMQRIHETTLETITPYERRVSTLLAAERLTQIYREARRRHKAATARIWLHAELAAMQQHAEKLAEFWRLGHAARQRRLHGK
jgi:hypothetical protein